MQITIRKAQESDRERLAVVEKLATPGLQYIPLVFDEFKDDESGDFAVVEADGEVVACGKFTVVPDGSAWLEALRVIPSHQGLGIGKLFYRRFFEQTEARGTKVMRMYTGLKNVTSKGLAERFGFHLDGTYRGAWAVPTLGDCETHPDPNPGPTGACCKPAPCSSASCEGAPFEPASCDSAPCSSASCERASFEPAPGGSASFEPVLDPNEAAHLLMPLKQTWADHFVMNRTFYEVTPALCATWAAEGKVFKHAPTGSVVAAGSRFIPQQAVHIAAFAGDPVLCLEFANKLALLRNAAKVICMFPPDQTAIQQTLLSREFQLEPSDCIVMKYGG